jgi:heptosyltransferase III
MMGGDSGIGHVAAALGTPVLSLFGPGDPARSAPVGSGVAILRRNPLSNLDVMEVEAAAMKALGGTAAVEGA